MQSISNKWHNQRKLIKIKSFNLWNLKSVLTNAEIGAIWYEQNSSPKFSLSRTRFFLFKQAVPENVLLANYTGTRTFSEALERLLPFPARIQILRAVAQRESFAGKVLRLFYSPGSKRIIISQRKSGKMLAERVFRKWTKVVSPLITRRPKQGKIKTPDASALSVCARRERALSCCLIYWLAAASPCI